MNWSSSMSSSWSRTWTSTSSSWSRLPPMQCFHCRHCHKHRRQRGPTRKSNRERTSIALEPPGARRCAYLGWQASARRCSPSVARGPSIGSLKCTSRAHPGPRAKPTFWSPRGRALARPPCGTWPQRRDVRLRDQRSSPRSGYAAPGVRNSARSAAHHVAHWCAADMLPVKLTPGHSKHLVSRTGGLAQLRGEVAINPRAKSSKSFSSPFTGGGEDAPISGTARP